LNKTIHWPIAINTLHRVFIAFQLKIHLIHSSNCQIILLFKLLNHVQKLNIIIRTGNFDINDAIKKEWDDVIAYFKK
jgi:hypothetical protein